ncbi:dynamin family protein [Streptomycetaceae bacterium NBC_01309]
MTDLEGLRSELNRTLELGCRWLAGLDAVLPGDGGAREQRAADVERLVRLHQRAASSLINIGLLGGFSSGKSFLLSGLQGHLTLRQVIHGGVLADQFIGILPSAPTPTTSCPATVVPVKDSEGELRAGGRGFLRVRFTDSDVWEEIGPDLSPIEVAAYASTETNVTARRERHWDRVVAELELLIDGYQLPAKLYDLPGHGSPNEIHNQIVRDRVHNADCFIYVANATRSLSDDDLDLMRFLHAEHGGRRVVWVVTAIDRAMEIGLDNKPAWQATVDLNNRYLHENFTLPDGRPDLGFIGGGFLPVSPAMEARGAFEAASGEPDRVARGNELRAAGRMDDLRRVINDVVRSGAGRHHVALVAAQTRAALEPHWNVAVDELRTLRIPVDQLTGEHDALRSRVRTFSTVARSTIARLERLLDERLRTVDRAFSGRRALAHHLHGELDAQVRETDVRRPRNLHRVEVRKTQAIEEWLNQDGAPTPLWDQQFEAFKSDVVAILAEVVRESMTEDELPRARRINVDDLVPPAERSPAEVQDIVQRAAGIVSLVAPLATGVATALGVVTGGLALIPIGVAAAAGALYGGIGYRKSRRDSNDVARTDYINHLDLAAAQVRQNFISAAGQSGSEVIERAQRILGDRRSQLEQRIASIATRMTDSEHYDLEERIRALEPVVAEGREALTALTDLSRSPNP